jgi:hypothetical protein
MDEPGTLQAVGDSVARMYGPRGLLVCGMSAEEQEAVFSMMQNGLSDQVAVIFVSDEMVDKSLKEILSLDAGYGKGQPSTIHRSMILSGFSEQELHWLIANYRSLGLPRPLWATLTPISEKWDIKHLLEELAAEDASYG